MKKQTKIKTRGGKRPGTGRPKKEPTVVISWRVPAVMAIDLKEKLTPVIEKAIEQRQKK